MNDAPEYTEFSVYVGVFLTTLGVGIWIGQYYLQMFTSWGWALLFGLIFFLIGYLFFYSDFRAYVGEKSVTEEFITSDEW